MRHEIHACQINPASVRVNLDDHETERVPRLVERNQKLGAVPSDRYGLIVVCEGRVLSSGAWVEAARQSGIDSVPGFEVDGPLDELLAVLGEEYPGMKLEHMIERGRRSVNTVGGVVVDHWREARVLALHVAYLWAMPDALRHWLETEEGDREALLAEVNAFIEDVGGELPTNSDAEPATRTANAAEDRAGWAAIFAARTAQHALTFAIEGEDANLTPRAPLTSALEALVWAERRPSREIWDELCQLVGEHT